MFSITLPWSWASICEGTSQVVFPPSSHRVFVFLVILQKMSKNKSCVAESACSCPFFTVRCRGHQSLLILHVLLLELHLSFSTGIIKLHVVIAIVRVLSSEVVCVCVRVCVCICGGLWCPHWSLSCLCTPSPFPPPYRRFGWPLVGPCVLA